MSTRACWHAVVLHWGRVEDTAACLDSLDALSFARVILIDNGSGAPALDALAAGRPGLRLVRQAENRGYAAGNNAGMRLALEGGAEFVAVVNNDAVLDYPRLLGDAETAFAAFAALGVLSPQVFFRKDGWHPQRVNLRFERAMMKLVTRGLASSSPTFPAAVAPTETFAGCCWLVPTRVVRRIGPLREDLFLYHEELEYAVRLRLAGLRCGQLGRGGGRVLHGGGTTAGLSPEQAYYGARNLLLLRESLPPATMGRAFALACARAAWMAARCVASGRWRSAWACGRGLTAGLRRQRGPMPVAPRRRVAT